MFLARARHPFGHHAIDQRKAENILVEMPRLLRIASGISEMIHALQRFCLGHHPPFRGISGPQNHPRQLSHGEERPAMQDISFAEIGHCLGSWSRRNAAMPRSGRAAARPAAPANLRSRSLIGTSRIFCAAGKGPLTVTKPMPMPTATRLSRIELVVHSCTMRGSAPLSKAGRHEPVVIARRGRVVRARAPARPPVPPCSRLSRSASR